MLARYRMSRSVESRPLFGLERVWLVADRLWPPFVNQQVLEGDAAPDAGRWRAALAALDPAWPAARARLHGALGAARWVADGPSPALVEVDGDGWDARGPAPFLARPLDPFAGPIAEVLLVRGDPPRVVLRTHHAAFDGRAAGRWAADLAAALDGRPLAGGALAGPLDVDVAPAVPPSPEPPRDRLAPTGAPTSAARETTWRRVTAPGPARDVLARALAALAGAAGTPVRVSIPVDLRGERRDLTGNHTGFVHLEPPAGEPARAALDAALAGGAAGGPVHAAHRLRWLPLGLMEAAGRTVADDLLARGRCTVSATVSNLGRQPVFAGGGFRAARSFWIPPGGSPLFVTLSGHAEGIEVCGSAPVGLAGEGRLDALLARVAEGFRA
ncbi:MAG: hypothetical protein ACOZNI_14945 [Myxococcota bacterium]